MEKIVCIILWASCKWQYNGAPLPGQRYDNAAASDGNDATGWRVPAAWTSACHVRLNYSYIQARLPSELCLNLLKVTKLLVVEP
jgi:hypothetical protein